MSDFCGAVRASKESRETEKKKKKNERIMWTKINETFGPSHPHFNDVKMARFGLRGKGERGLIVPIYAVQD